MKKIKIDEFALSMYKRWLLSRHSFLVQDDIATIPYESQGNVLWWFSVRIRVGSSELYSCCHGHLNEYVIGKLSEYIDESLEYIKLDFISDEIDYEVWLDNQFEGRYIFHNLESHSYDYWGLEGEIKKIIKASGSVLEAVSKVLKIEEDFPDSLLSRS